MLVFVLQASSASAGIDWRDGCPAVPARTDTAGAFGPVAERDSAFAPTGVSLGTEASRVTLVTAQPARRDAWIDRLRVDGRLNLPAGLTLAVGATDAVGDRAGNLRFLIGYRDARRLFSDTARAGWALRVGTAINPFADSGDDDLFRLARGSPFAASTFAFDRPITFTLEARGELIGCHGPFIHLHASVTEWRDERMAATRADAPVLITAPLAVSLGDYVSQRVALVIDLGVEFRNPVTTLDVRHVTRVRALTHVRVSDDLTLLVHGDAFSGGEFGVALGVDLDLDLGAPGALE